MLLTRSIAAAAAAAVLALGAGCAESDSGSSGATPPSPTPTDNGVANLPASQIMSRAQAALKKASSVHLKGKMASEGEQFTIDLRMSDKGGTGTMTQAGQTLQLLRIGTTVYIRADEDFWRTQTGSDAAAELLKGKYLKGTTSDPKVASLALFTDADKFVAELFSPKRTVTKGAKKTVRGVEAISLISPGKDGGTLYVATRGEPYPLQIASNTQSEPGLIDFLDYGAPVKLTAPPADQVVDTSKLGSR
jgi:hypothetical protein